MLSHGELFAGISGFGLGFERAGLPVSWAVEIDEQCRRVLRRYHPDALILKDVMQCGAHNLPPVDVISFGSPCQDLSVAGKRAGMKGERSGLYFDAIRIIRELNPAIAIWENVLGAFSSSSGRDFGAALDALADAGALDIGWAVLDSQWFGVAQRRRRVFVVADFRGRRAGEILSIPYGGPGDPPPRRQTGARVAPTINAGANRTGGTRPPGYNAEEAETLQVVGLAAVQGVDKGDEELWRDARGIRPPEGVRVVAFDNGQGDPNADEDGTAFALNGQMHSGVAVARPLGAGRSIADAGGDEGNIAIVATLTAKRGGSHMSEVENGIVAFDPLMAGSERTFIHRKNGKAQMSGRADAVSGPMGVRRLTPVEFCRLQGFPDDWLDGLGISDSVKYRMLGNAVTTTVAEWIGRRLLAMVGAS